MEAEDDPITRRMKMHLLEKKGKLFYTIANDFTGFSSFEKEETVAAEGEEEESKASGEQIISDDMFDRTFMKGHKAAITCMDWTADNKSLITGSKDCSLIKWDLETQSKLFFRGRKFDKNFAGHNDEVLCAAISPNGKYLVSGGKDRLVRVWDIHNQTQIQTFLGHRDSITGITFDSENDQFYTVSKDRSLKMWNIREMAYMDTHYGHHSDISVIESFSRDRVLTCSTDSQCIFWKVNENSELLYPSKMHTCDTLNVINSQYFLTGGSDNAMDLWIMNKKRPIYSLEGLHRNDSWLLSTANVRNSDLFASGSYDGQVLIYGFRRTERDFGVLGRFQGLHGCINAMKFSHARASNDLYTGMKSTFGSNIMLAVSHSKDERMGRWHSQKNTKTGVTILRKKASE